MNDRNNNKAFFLYSKLIVEFYSMPAQTSHCISEQCKNSAEMMCEHESVLSMQHQLDNLRWSLSRFKPQDLRRERMDQQASLLFDKEITASSCVSPIHSSSTSSLNEFYLRPCHKATHQNNLSKRNGEICTYTHQLYGNHTRMGTGRSINEIR